MFDSRLLRLSLGLVSVVLVWTGKPTRADDEAILFTPAGFNRPGQAILKPPATCGHLKVTIRDAARGEPTFCRVNVVGSDGNFYYPKPNYLTPYALTGQWTGKPPNTALGNRAGKAPIRYLGRFFYSWGQIAGRRSAGPGAGGSVERTRISPACGHDPNGQG